MWTATIKDKVLKQGKLTVNVSFHSDTDEFNELFTLVTGKELDGYITNRLSQLEALEAFECPLGAYTPVVSEVPPLQDKINTIYKFKNLIEAGVITEKDPAYVKAIADAQILYENQ